MRKYDKLVFLCDGAKWIWNWVIDTFPKAIQLLDYFHAMEHIGEYGKIFFDDDVLRKDWISLQQERLLTDGVAEIVEELEQEKITAIGNLSKAKHESLTQLINYISENSKRMFYKTYKRGRWEDLINLVKNK